MTLDQYLSRNGIKPSTFAAELGVSASTITRILKGERKPGIEIAVRISALTDGQVTANDFLPEPQARAS